MPVAHRNAIALRFTTPIVLLAALVTTTPALKLAAQGARRSTSNVARLGSAMFSNPPVLRNMSSKPGTVEVSITAAPARLELVPGKISDVYAYNGSIPGPTLEAHEGDHVIIHFHNNLSEPSTIHCHGIHLPAAMDGSPFGLVPAGGHFDYEFTLKRGTAGTYWYHPHPDLRSEYQVTMGLAGAIIVRAADDPIASLPERVLVLSDNRFRPDGRIDFPDSTSIQAEVDEENGREGNVMLVNGHVMPTLNVAPGEVQRWRIINASASRVYRLAIPGQTLLQVGSDGGLLEHAVEQKDIVLASSERAEILVRGAASGEHAELQTLPYDRYMPQTRPPDWNSPHSLVAIAYTGSPPATPVVIPAVLREIPALDPSSATATHVIVMSQGMIDGRTMDMDRVDVHTTLGATEIWQLENVVGMDHPFHLHGFEFQVLDRNGVTEPFRSWKDVVNVPRHQTVRFIVHYTDFAGKWMFHCHILAHEDQGMMAVLEVK